MKPKPSANSNPPSVVTEQFLFRVYSGRFEFYLTIPDSYSEELLCLPTFGMDMMRKGLGLDDDAWDWRGIKRSTANKATGRKLTGGKFVLHMWGFLFKASKPVKSLQKIVPYKINCLDISDGKGFPMLRVISGK